MGAIKKVFHSIGDGIKGAFEGVGHIVKGAVTLNFGEVAKGVGGVVSNGMALTPQALCANALMDGAMSMLGGNSGMPGMPPAPDFSLAGPDDDSDD